jgi:hypothetical protein
LTWAPPIHGENQLHPDLVDTIDACTIRNVTRQLAIEKARVIREIDFFMSRSVGVWQNDRVEIIAK